MASVPFNMIMNSPLAEKYLGKINEILSQEMERTLNIIRENFEKIQLLAQALLERSRLDTKEMKSIISIPESASEKAGTKTESVKNKTKAGKRSKKREQDSDALL